MAQLVKNLPAMQETWVQSLGWDISWRREKLPTPVSWPGEFHGQYGVAKHWTRLSNFHFHFHTVKDFGVVNKAKVDVVDHGACYGLNVCVPPNFICSNPNPKVMVL